MRASALVATAGRLLLIDTAPELRLQLVDAGVDRVDAVLYTHAHADHVHGIDDLRALSLRRGADRAAAPFLVHLRRRTRPARHE